MNATKVLRQAAAAQHRTPLIRFLGKRSAPSSIDHTPAAHPAAPSNRLPDSFAAYREKAQQHGPLSQRANFSSSSSRSGESLGPVEAPAGMYFDRDELPSRFRRTPFSQAEIEAIESGGASMFG
ncbi:MAG: hypothetical protein M1819_005214 [Sarea resinae]|nr:MAG: hypothetical protein M1819_005214 [Sarea resinae]